MDRKIANIRRKCVPTFVDSAVFPVSLLMNHRPGVAVGVVGGEAHCVNLASGQGGAVALRLIHSSSQEHNFLICRMASSTPSPTQLIHAYRHLYKALLYAVRYSKPSRYVVRDELRSAFRKSDPRAYDAGKIARTLEFIEGAGREKGIENQILKNMCQTEHMRKYIATT